MKKYVIHAFIAFSVFSLVKVWQNVSVGQLNRRNVKMSRELQQLEYEKAVLTDKVETLTHVDRIERIAKEKLGFVPAEKINMKLKDEENK